MTRRRPQDASGETWLAYSLRVRPRPVPAALDAFDWEAFERERVDDDYVHEDCPECGGEGFVQGDCGEDTCCCACPEAQHPWEPCPQCKP